jgi:hypothetical protein
MHAKLAGTAAAAIGALMATGLGNAQVAQAASAIVSVPCSVTALASDMSSASSGETLSLTPRCYYHLTAGLPVVIQDLTILGRGATVERSFAQGTPTFTILEVDFGTLTVSGLNFRNGNGAISVVGTANLTVNGGTFTGNRATDGAAISESYTAANDLTVNGATFTGNRATDAGGAIWDNYGAGDLTVNGATFTGNTAMNAGGAIFDNSGNGLVMNGGTFTRNYAPQGGAIFNNANGGEFITRAVFRGNKAVTGGGIYNNSELLITNSNISGNDAAGQGGGLYNDAGNALGKLDTADVIFRGNNARDGGGIYIANGIVNLADSEISGNNVTADGGGIYQDNFGLRGSLTLAGSEISANNARAHGGGIYNEGPLTVGSSQIVRNEAASGGGGLYDDDYYGGVAVTLTGSTVLYNKPDNCEPADSITACTG